MFQQKMELVSSKKLVENNKIMNYCEQNKNHINLSRHWNLHIFFLIPLNKSKKHIVP